MNIPVTELRQATSGILSLLNSDELRHLAILSEREKMDISNLVISLIKKGVGLGLTPFGYLIDRQDKIIRAIPDRCAYLLTEEELTRKSKGPPMDRYALILDIKHIPPSFQFEDYSKYKCQGCDPQEIHSCIRESLEDKDSTYSRRENLFQVPKQYIDLRVKIRDIPGLSYH